MKEKQRKLRTATAKREKRATTTTNSVTSPKEAEEQRTDEDGTLKMFPLHHQGFSTNKKYGNNVKKKNKKKRIICVFIDDIELFCDVAVWNEQQQQQQQQQQKQQLQKPAGCFICEEMLASISAWVWQRYYFDSLRDRWFYSRLLHDAIWHWRDYCCVEHLSRLRQMRSVASWTKLEIGRGHRSKKLAFFIFPANRLNWQLIHNSNSNNLIVDVSSVLVRAAPRVLSHQRQFRLSDWSIHWISYRKEVLALLGHLLPFQRDADKHTGMLISEAEVIAVPCRSMLHVGLVLNTNIKSCPKKMEIEQQQQQQHYNKRMKHKTFKSIQLWFILMAVYKQCLSPSWLGIKIRDRTRLSFENFLIIFSCVCVCVCVW